MNKKSGLPTKGWKSKISRFPLDLCDHKPCQHALRVVDHLGNSHMFLSCPHRACSVNFFSVLFPQFGEMMTEVETPCLRFFHLIVCHCEPRFTSLALFFPFFVFCGYRVTHSREGSLRTQPGFLCGRTIVRALLKWVGICALRVIHCHPCPDLLLEVDFFKEYPDSYRAFKTEV